jgi:hypothetical protein
MNSNGNLSESFSLLKYDEAHLKEIIKKSPWCSLAQLYLLHNYKSNNSASFDIQARKTVLFFKNSNWLQWQLHQLTQENTIKEQKIDVIEKENIIVDNLEETNVNADNTVADITPPSDNIEENNEKVENTFAEISPKANTNEEILAFEPLHTIDYFASQGIKITEEPITNDKLGSQMKSFTEWLKSMKKIHKENLPAGDEQTDKNIQRLAEHSNTDAEIVTEAMADVLIKQNKTDKAIEVYHKLSLQNPSKSGYFTAKINSLSSGRQF